MVMRETSVISQSMPRLDPIVQIVRPLSLSFSPDPVHVVTPACVRRRSGAGTSARACFFRWQQLSPTSDTPGCRPRRFNVRAILAYAAVIQAHNCSGCKQRRIRKLGRKKLLMGYSQTSSVTAYGGASNPSLSPLMEMPSSSSACGVHPLLGLELFTGQG